MKFTKDDIREHLTTLVTTGAITKMACGLFVNNILNKIETIPELRSTTRDKFVRAHERIGSAALDVWDKVVKWMYDQEQAAIKANNAVQDAIIAENRRKAEEARHEAEINPRFTSDQIKTLQAMMDLCGIAEIDLRRINDFFAAVKAKDWSKPAATQIAPLVGNPVSAASTAA